MARIRFSLVVSCGSYADSGGVDRDGTMTLAETGRGVRVRGMSRWFMVLVCLLAPVGVRAQMMQGIVNGKSPAAGGFVGPLDVVTSATPLFCVSFRPCSGAIAASGTQRMFALTAGATSCDFLATNTAPFYGNTANCGGANGQTLAVFCSGGCVVQAGYDQLNVATFNNFLAATDPTFTTAGGPSTGKPAMTCNSATPQYLGATVPGTGQPYSVSSVVNRTSGFTSQLPAGFTMTGSPFTQMSFNTSPNGVFLYAGNISPIASETDNVWHTFIGVYSSASSTLKVDAAAPVTGDPGTSVFGGSSMYTCGGPATGVGSISESELIAFSGAMSSGDQTALQSNQHTFFGF